MKVCISFHVLVGIGTRNKMFASRFVSRIISLNVFNGIRLLYCYSLDVSTVMMVTFVSSLISIFCSSKIKQSD